MSAKEQAIQREITQMEEASQAYMAEKSRDQGLRKLKITMNRVVRNSLLGLIHRWGSRMRKGLCDEYVSQQEAVDDQARRDGNAKVATLESKSQRQELLLQDLLARSNGPSREMEEQLTVVGEQVIQLDRMLDLVQVTETRLLQLLQRYGSPTGADRTQHQRPRSPLRHESPPSGTPSRRRGSGGEIADMDRGELDIISHQPQAGGRMSLFEGSKETNPIPLPRSSFGKVEELEARLHLLSEDLVIGGSLDDAAAQGGSGSSAVSTTANGEGTQSRAETPTHTITGSNPFRTRLPRNFSYTGSHDTRTIVASDLDERHKGELCERCGAATMPDGDYCRKCGAAKHGPG